MAIKGQKQTFRTAEEKYKIIEPIINGVKSQSQVSKENSINAGLIHSWIKKYDQNGINGLEIAKKPGNSLTKYLKKKRLTKEEQLEYENMKLRIENELLKKGFLMKEDGTLVKFTK